jgi:uncharacterized protein (TIGR02996 family)
VSGHRDALLRAICENPRDDTPRLAFADWLDENGQEARAAFIRTDIAMALRAEWDTERLRWEEDCERKVASRAGHDAARSTTHFPLLPDSLTWLDGLVTRRGFPWGIRVALHRVLLDLAAELFAQYPIEFVSFLNTPHTPTQLVNASWFARLTGLEFCSGRTSVGTLSRLLNTPVDLQELRLGGRAIDSARLESIFASPLPAKLRRLTIRRGGTAVERAMLDALANWPTVHHLRTLELLEGVVVSDVYRIGERLPPGVTSLNLRTSHMNSDRGIAFAARAGLAGLKVLNLASNPLGNAGATALFTSPHLAGLKVLDLSYCQVGDEALRALLDNSPLADGLNLLNLTGSPASGDMKQAVKDRMGERVRV